MIAMISFKLFQLRLIEQAINNAQQPTWIQPHMHSFRLHILREIRFLRERLFEHRHIRSNNFWDNKSEIFSRFKDDLADNTYAGYNASEVMQQSDTIMWVKIIEQVNEYRFENNSDVMGQTMFYIVQSEYVPYNGANNYSMIRDHLVNHMFADDASWTCISLIVYAYSNGML